MKNWILMLLLLAGAWSCSPSSSSPDNPGEDEGEITVTGIIYDDSAKPLADVLVSDGYIYSYDFSK